MAITMQSIKEAVEVLKSLLPADFKPEIGIIGGSGLSALEDAVMEPRWEVPYGKIKGFPVSTGKLSQCNDEQRERIYGNIQLLITQSSSGPCGQVGFWSRGQRTHAYSYDGWKSTVRSPRTGRGTPLICLAIMKAMSCRLLPSQSVFWLFLE
jgi:hypothetical protein